MKRITKDQAINAFQPIKDSLPQNDIPMLREEWSNYVDSLQKDGYITEHQANAWVHPF